MLILTLALEMHFQNSYTGLRVKEHEVCIMATYTKSEKYKGIAQRKNGTWFYRIKLAAKDHKYDEYYQESGFATEEDAYKARLAKYRDLHRSVNDMFEDDDKDAAYLANYKTFAEAFAEFVNRDAIPASTKKKYMALYNAQLKDRWGEFPVQEINDSDIEILLLSLSLVEWGGSNKRYSSSYISSIRKMLRLFFQYYSSVDISIDASVGQTLFPNLQPETDSEGHKKEFRYKLRLLSLFSGIGAPERALQNIGIEYDLVNFCEIEPHAIKAYCLLHGLDYEKELVPHATDKKNLGDITKVHPVNIPNLDMIVMGFPCQDLSAQGKQRGLRNKDGEITRSGLFFEAMRIARAKRPKIIIAENVEGLTHCNMSEAFKDVINTFLCSGYHCVQKVLNAEDFGVPQHRKRIFFILFRRDCLTDFIFPKGDRTLKPRASDWFKSEVDNECYVEDYNVESLLTRKSYKPFLEDYESIHCITTGWGSPSYTNQTFLHDEKGYRCLCSEELMHFQGFNEEDATLLRNNGFSRDQVGELVGNSIAVPVLEAVFKSLFRQLESDYSTARIKAIQEHNEKYGYDAPFNVERRGDTGYIEPLFSYSGNKEKLLPDLLKRFPKNLSTMTFVDLFAGAATVSVNVNANEVHINEVEPFLADIYKALSDTSPKDAWQAVLIAMQGYHLSEKDAEAYRSARRMYNVTPRSERGKNWAQSLMLVYHSFCRNMVRFNSEGDLNSGAGYSEKKDITQVNVPLSRVRFFPFANRLFTGNFNISCKDFREFDFDTLDPKSTFIYLDPPYLITKASYNTFWHEKDDIELYELLDTLNEKGFKWMLSNVTHNKGETNNILIKWIEDNSDTYHVERLDRDYARSMATSKDFTTGTTVEVIVYNYDI